VAHQQLTRFLMDIASRSADLFIGVGRDVFHEEVENAGVALENAEQLQRTVRGFHFRRGRLGRRGLRFGGEAEFGDQVRGQFASEQKREECAESQ
jgi:hypothetical protein